MAKQFTFNQFRWNGCTVHFNQGHIAAIAFFVQPTSDQFLTRSIFAGNKDASFGRGYFFNRFFDLSDGGSFADDIESLGNFSFEKLGFGNKIVFIDGVANGNQQSIQIRWLGDEIIGAFFGCVDCHFHVAMT